MIEIKNKKDYDALFTQAKPVLLDFYADWCGPCQALLPTVEKLSEKYKNDFVIAKINVDHNQELAQEFNVRSIPSLFFMENKEVKDNLLGNQTEAFLESKIQSFLVKS